jgi:hypothetical protein
MSLLKVGGVLVALAAPAFAAEPLHWYEIATTGPQRPATFTGSSPLDSTQMAQRLKGEDPIVLENLRSTFAQPDKGIAWGCHPDDSAVRILFVPRAISYVRELPGDPAEEKPRTKTP